ncbi:MAG: MAPEG family protein [Caulobacterales bacterium]
MIPHASHPQHLTALVTLLAVLHYMLTVLRASQARRKSGLRAPAVTGDDAFERNYRVQMNTLESLPVFLVALWFFAFSWGEFAASGVGLVWIVGRTLYMLSYVDNPDKRGQGFALAGLALVTLVVGSLVGVVMALAANHWT